MKALCVKYARKMAEQGLCSVDAPLVGGLDDVPVWNREDSRCAELSGLFDRLAVNALVFARPAEPYAGILDFLAARYPSVIRPGDTETRTFLHDIPVCPDFSTESLAEALGRRKSAVIPGHGVIAAGTVGPEQGFVFYSSTLFAGFVLFFSEYLAAVRRGDADPAFRQAFERAAAHLPPVRTDPPALTAGPFADGDAALAAMAEAGRAVVGYGLVDSFFGNISCRLGDVVHISQTGSSLDELEGCVDPCPLDGSTTNGLTASSELSAHEGVYRSSDADCILHGHPKFSVILSMDCERTDCPNRGRCHVACVERRSVEGAPIVPGEIGAGPTGLCNTLPPAVAASGAAVVHGHGVFVAGRTDFNVPFARLLDLENRCRQRYFARVTAEIA